MADELSTAPGKPADFGATEPAPVVGAGGAGLAESMQPGGDPLAGRGGGDAKPRGKPGRPAIHGRYSRAAGSDGKRAVDVGQPASVAALGSGGGEPVEVGASPETVPAIPPAVLAEIITELIGTLENLSISKLEALALRCGLSKEEIKPHLEAVELGAGKREIIAKLIPYALEEWDISASSLSPTLAIFVTLAPSVVAGALAMFTLTKLAKNRLAPPAPAATATP